MNTSIFFLSPTIFIAVLFACACFRHLALFCFGQKTRNPQQRRPYIGTRARPSLPQTDSTIYVSPANLPPPPKYEAMAPPSYEEVVGIHYPNYQLPQVQPITQPIATALAQNTNTSVAATNIPENTNVETPSVAPATVLTVTNERTDLTARS